jgi:hypothetical protein
MNTILFTPVQRARLAALADQVIPAGNGAASASEAGISTDLLDRVIVLVPERAALLQRVVQRSATLPPDAALTTLREQDRAEYDLFCETVAGAYFMSPLVRDQIRYPGRVPVPARSDIADMEDLIMVVYEAGFAPRQP